MKLSRFLNWGGIANSDYGQPISLFKIRDCAVKVNARPIRLCTFSRVMKEKGIEDAAQAVYELNRETDKKYLLDIYGQIDSRQTEWFETIIKKYADSIEYKGTVPFEQSTNVLKNYYALLFPTYYSGEGFAGTLLDAMAAGLPIIASDWKYNNEIVNKNIGRLFNVHDINELKKQILSLKDVHAMKKAALAECRKYGSDQVVLTISERLR